LKLALICVALPAFDRDDFKDAMFETLGWSDRGWSRRVGTASWELLYLCIERLVAAETSFMAESNFRPADSLVARLRDLCAANNVRPIEIYCTATPDALWERFVSRRRTGGRHAGHAGFETAAEETQAGFDVELPEVVARKIRRVTAVALLVPGVGSVIRNDASSGAEAMLTCLALVTSRLPLNAEIIYLTAENEQALLNWEAERYRQQLTASNRQQQIR